MEKEELQSSNLVLDEEEIMNRVNQTYDKLAEDVKNMINSPKSE